MKFDPAAALKAWPVTVVLYDREWTIPPLPASDWLAAYVTDGESGIIPGLLGDEAATVVADAVLDAFDGVGDIEDTDPIAREAIEIATGVSPWWVAARLMGWAATADIAGKLIRQGVDYDRVSLGGVIAAVWSIIQEVPDDKGQRAKLVMELEQPPPGVDAEPTEMDATWFTGTD